MRLSPYRSIDGGWMPQAGKRSGEAIGDCPPPPEEPPSRKEPPHMLTLVQRNALDRFVKSLATLGDDSLIDAYHQAWEDHRDARAEGSDNLDKAGAEGLATETAMRRRFADYQSRYKARYP